MSIPQPLPRIAAFEKLGFGMFVHWGLYSQMGTGEWIQHAGNIDYLEYAWLQSTFTAEDFDADKLAQLAKAAGMKYIVLTTRHHEGFSLYDTCGLNEYDAPHSPAKRDLVKEFVEGCRRHDIVPFFYHTTIDWSWHGKETKDLEEPEFNEYLDYLYKSVEILCRNYGKIGGLWFDGNWSRPQSDWKPERLYGMIRENQPEAIIINNTGLEAGGKIGHAGVDAVTFENQAAKPMDREGHSKYVAAEVCKTMNSHWGIGGRDFNFKSPAQIIEQLCHSRGCGANLLLNIGPTAQGGIPAYEKALLELVGRWLEIFGEGYYEAMPDTEVICHGRDFMLKNGRDYFYYVFDLGIQGNEDVTVDVEGIGTRSVDRFFRKILSANWLDNGTKVDFIQNQETGMASFRCTGYPYGSNTVVRVLKIVTE